MKDGLNRAGLAGMRVARLSPAPLIYFNPELKSRFYILPGIIALTTAILAALLTSLVIAREWERGTMEQLIATPVPAAPPAVALVQVKGEVPSTRPWVRYEYADPQLEALSAGQKILLRMGADNQRRLQAKLVDLRGRVARR